MNDLLKVLDMSEEQQQIWLIKKEVMVGAVLQCKGGGELPCPSESLADLAFRLRDEVISNDLKNETGWWCEESYEVFLYVIGEENEQDEVGLDTWFAMYAKPIHWIIAALIAKEQK